MPYLLDLYRKPLVKFEPSNPEHRQMVATFLKDGTWSTCPVRFYTPGDISVKAYTLDSLVQYYLNQEFPEPSPKRSRKLIKT